MIICNLESNKVHNKDDLPAQLPALNRVTWRQAVVAVSLCLDVTVAFVVIIMVFVVSLLIIILLLTLSQSTSVQPSCSQCLS